ncbi:protein ABHD11 [Orussus abietinus]|uniref:protein ABHD11 n=1 Tax=Orussus abietinus TaxID=222816 RepID=UPI000626917E|nr:protein ABHD11 [Orussus abietinus]
MILMNSPCNRVKCLGKQIWTTVLPAMRHIASRELHNVSENPATVKLAYVSYESMADTAEENSTAPIMIMHGLFGSKNNWNSLAKVIHQKTNRKVIAIDARNHGDSPHSSEVSYAVMAEDVIHLLKDLCIDKAILIGHSMGGSTMMYVALFHPEVVEKLVVVDMSPIGTSPEIASMKKIFESMRSITLDGNLSLTKARKMTDEQLSNSISSLTLRQFLLTNLVEAETGKYKWRVNLPALEQHFEAQIARFPDVGPRSFNGPTLFIGGSNSDYIKVKDHPAIKRLFPEARFHYIAGASHWLHAEKPAEFLNILTSFINQTDR